MTRSTTTPVWRSTGAGVACAALVAVAAVAVPPAFAGGTTTTGATPPATTARGTRCSGGPSPSRARSATSSRRRPQPLEGARATLRMTLGSSSVGLPADGQQDRPCGGREDLRRAPAQRALRAGRRCRGGTALQQRQPGGRRRRPRGVARLHRHQVGQRVGEDRGPVRPGPRCPGGGHPRDGDRPRHGPGGPAAGLPPRGLVMAPHESRGPAGPPGLLRAAALGAAGGAAWGVAARAWMRLVSTSHEFSWAGTLAIIGLATVLGTGVGLASAARRHRGWRRWLRLAVVPGLLLFAGTGAAAAARLRARGAAGRAQAPARQGCGRPRRRGPGSRCSGGPSGSTRRPCCRRPCTSGGACWSACP